MAVYDNLESVYALHDRLGVPHTEHIDILSRGDDSTMKTYVLEHPDKGTITYTDRKRYLWLLSTFYPLLPFLGMYVAIQTGSDWGLWLPLALVYVVVPILDSIFGQDESNPPEEVVPLLEEDRYYRILTYLTVPMHFIALIGGAWYVGTQPISLGGFVALALSIGLMSGLAINTGHELGHKSTAIEKFLAKIVLAVPAYGHFTLEHTLGHHGAVATPEDTASARFGESIYKFARREIPGGIRRGWALEAQRLQRKGHGAWSIHNEILQSYALTVVLYGSLIAAFGWLTIPFLAVQTFWAWWQLTSANYVEHYGLLREKKANGRYERCKPHHSWNANHIFSNVILFHLERHSDHHAWAARRYQSLRNFDGVPALPTGYFGMWTLAYIPWAWRKVMDPKVVALVDGDMTKVNIDPDVRARLMARYHKPTHPAMAA